MSEKTILVGPESFPATRKNITDNMTRNNKDIDSDDGFQRMMPTDITGRRRPDRSHDEQRVEDMKALNRVLGRKPKGPE